MMTGHSKFEKHLGTNFNERKKNKEKERMNDSDNRKR